MVISPFNLYLLNTEHPAMINIAIAIAIVENDATSLDELMSRLHQSGGATLSSTGVANLKVWLASRDPSLLLLPPSKENEQTPAFPADKPMPAMHRGKAPTCWLLDAAQQELTAPCGKVIPLTHSEFCLLRAGVNACERMVSRKTLIEALGQSPLHYNEKCLEMLISRLRSKLASATQESFSIRGVRNQGYFFGSKLQQVGV